MLKPPTQSNFFGPHQEMSSPSLASLASLERHKDTQRYQRHKAVTSLTAKVHSRPKMTFVFERHGISLKDLAPSRMFSKDITCQKTENIIIKSSHDSNTNSFDGGSDSGGVVEYSDQYFNFQCCY